MKKIVTLVIIGLIIIGCAPIHRLQNSSKPVMYDNVIISIATDNLLLFPQTTDKDFIPLLSSHLNDATKNEILRQGNLKVTSSCAPRTLKANQEITGMTVNTVTDVNTGFFIFQLLRGKATSTQSNIIYINTTMTILDCETGKILGSYPYQFSGQNPIDILQDIASYNVYNIYDNQRGSK
jgi:hypothetical protein